jgi:hypothetical protein
MPEGINTITAAAHDVLDKSGSSSSASWKVKVDRNKPALTLSGPLYDAQTGWLYDATADLHIVTTDGVAGSDSQRRSGVKQIDVYVKRLGEEYVLKKTFPQDCTAADSCPLNRDYTLNADEYADGGHMVKVVATDYANNPPREEEFTLNIDRRGDVYHSRIYGVDGADTTLQLESEEWARPQALAVREEAPETITTRSQLPCEPSDPSGAKCLEYRQRSRFSEQYPGDGDTYTVYRGSSETDQRIPEAGLLLTARELSTADAVRRGPLGDVVEAWQTRPPAHGAEYELFESRTTEDVSESAGETDSPAVLVEYTMQLWRDAGTKLPVKDAITGSDGTRRTRYYDYAPDRAEATELPPDFFAVGQPESTISDKRHTSHGINAAGAQTDRETGAAFTPYYLGPTPALPSGIFCLATTASVSLDEPGPDSITAGELGTDPEALDLQPAPQAEETEFDAYYNQLASDETCSPGNGPLEAPPLELTSMARQSSGAAAWRQGFQEAGATIQGDVFHEDFFTAGVQPVTIESEPATAYVVRVGEGMHAALIDIGGTTLMITGPFDKTTLEQVLSHLRSR